MTKHYRLDPKNPPQLTEEEARRLDETPIDYSNIPELDDEFFSRAKTMIDWTQCPDVESVPGRCSGAWVVKNSRVIVESCILGNAEDCTPEEIADMFEVPGGVEVVKRILAFAGRKDRSTTDTSPEAIWIDGDDNLSFEWYPTEEAAKNFGTPVKYIRSDIAEGIENDASKKPE